MKKEDLFQRAAALKIEITAKEEEYKALLPELLVEMNKKEADEVKLESGSFIRYFRRIWRYPESIKTAEETVKAMKKDAEATGSAQYDEVATLKFMSKKYE